MEPEKRLSDEINRCKIAAKNIVCEHKFLDDPPHLTIIVSQVENKEQWEDRFWNIASRYHKFTLEVTGWHVFEETGNMKTLACDVEKTQDLSEFQKEISLLLKQYKNGRLSRYDDIKDPVLLSNVEEYGFPFVGDIWLPHISIGSFNEIDFINVKKMLESRCPKGSFTLESTSIIDVSEDDYRKLSTKGLSHNG
ncbi:MAG: 2'-5' RNA ligase family protein [Candidatus Woesearchaeota archaeon]